MLLGNENRLWFMKSVNGLFVKTKNRNIDLPSKHAVDYSPKVNFHFVVSKYLLKAVFKACKNSPLYDI